MTGNGGRVVPSLLSEGNADGRGREGKVESEDGKKETTKPWPGNGQELEMSEMDESFSSSGLCRSHYTKRKKR